MVGQASEIDDVRVVTLPDFTEPTRSHINTNDPTIVEIGFPEQNLVLRLRGVPKIYKAIIEYDIASRCHKVGLFSKHWKLNSYLELKEYCSTMFPQATQISLEVIEWSRIISSASSRSTRPSVPSPIGELGTESG